MMDFLYAVMMVVLVSSGIIAVGVIAAILLQNIYDE